MINVANIFTPCKIPLTESECLLLRRLLNSWQTSISIAKTNESDWVCVSFVRPVWGKFYILFLG